MSSTDGEIGIKNLADKAAQQIQDKIFRTVSKRM